MAQPPHLRGHRGRHHAVSWSGWRRRQQAIGRRVLDTGSDLAVGGVVFLFPGGEYGLAGAGVAVFVGVQDGRRNGGDKICRRLSSRGRAAGGRHVDAVLMLGTLAWFGALLAGVAVIGDGPMGPVLTLGGFAAFILMAIGVTIVPRQLRWRGDVRPRSTGRPASDPGYPLKPGQIAVEERWGATQQIAETGWVREVGRLRWRQATVFLVGDRTGLVVDPWFLSRRAYIFDSTCHVGPGPTPATLNPGFNLRRRNGVLRISQGTQMIDLAIPINSVPTVALIGAPGPVDTPVTVSEERLARIARADRRAARGHEFFARINARSRTNRWVATACSLFCLAVAISFFIGGMKLGQYGAIPVMLSLYSLGAAGVYAGRVVFRDEHGWPSGRRQGR